MNSTMNTLPSTYRRGWLAKSKAAKAKHLKVKDPARMLAVRVRAMKADVESAGVYAQAEFDAFHAPVPSPIPQEIHRDVAKLLNRFLEEHDLVCADLTKPLEPHESLADIRERHRIRLQAECDEGVRELAEMERERALERIRAAEAGLERVDAQHEAYGIEPPVASGSDDGAETAEAADAPRRRGRPPKALSPVQVVIEPDADVTPD